MKPVFLLTALLFCTSLSAQTKPDTVFIDAGQINTKFLKESGSRYLVYFIPGQDLPRSRPQFWTRSITFENYKGREVIAITQEWEDKDTIVHKVKSVCDKKTFEPLYHQSWWKQGGSSEYDFTAKTLSMNGEPVSDTDTAASKKWPLMAFREACKQYTLNWHIDLEVFQVLPYKEGVTFMIPFYDPGSRPPGNEVYTVSGSAKLAGYNGQEIDCWLLSHESKGLKEVFWVSKKTQEVLKLENEIGKNKWRYKIRLAYSI